MFFAPKPDGNRLFLIDGAADEDGERRQIIGFADDELGAPQRDLHLESEAVAGGAQSHAHRELVTKQQIHLLGGKERTSSQSVHGLNFAGMEVEASHALCLVTHGEKNPEPALVHLFVNEELRKAPVNFVLRCGAVRAEQVLLATDGVVEWTLLLSRFGCLVVAQLELLDPPLDGSQDARSSWTLDR